MTGMRRETVDLSGYPHLVVIYPGLRVHRLRGLITLWRLRRLIRHAVAQKPDGLLRHEPLIYSGFPPHLGMRQYWRDLDSLLSWTGSSPHRRWQDRYAQCSHGVGFWHEIYFVRNGRDAVYFDMPAIGLKQLAPKTVQQSTSKAEKSSVRNESDWTAVTAGLVRTSTPAEYFDCTPSAAAAAIRVARP